MIVEYLDKLVKRFGSYITISGRIFLSETVVFMPFLVSPRNGVASLPEYVVGIAICG